MIISASRRTDIPALYSEWFMNRIRARFCTVPNPFNIRQVSEVSLKAEDVDAIVFWTRYARPLIQYFKALDERGFYYYFQYTINGYGPRIESANPPLENAIRCFREVSDRLGPERVIWRYDPIILTSVLDTEYHLELFSQIAGNLRGHTLRCVISLVDFYKKTRRRLSFLADEEVITEHHPAERSLIRELLIGIQEIARGNNMEVVTCAEQTDFSDIGIMPGKCIDDKLLTELFPGRSFSGKKDPGQRKLCRCVQSRDIGMNNSCIFGCRYCYANKSDELSGRNYTQNHFPDSPSMLGRYESR
ncbi:DUF1848 domain-containing protein [Desulfonema magnum]|uniref:DUF1848 n=1 Tax=Desulfonema magnum TaxID=45655 RepID=A0A975GS66_9BACT|nr:DUF1848 domain-containing protein [Desulfonema magnum]QTA91709.1 DUF1848 [Desulfonema magnum]